MIYALWWMSKTAKLKGAKVTSRSYESARKQFIENNPNSDLERKNYF